MDWGSVKPLPCESKANGGQIYLEHVGSKFSLLFKVTFVKKKKKKTGGYPGSLVVRIQLCHSSGQGSNPGWGTEILKFTWCGPNFFLIFE